MILLEIEDRRIVISLSQGRKAKAYHRTNAARVFLFCTNLIPLLLTKLSYLDSFYLIFAIVDLLKLLFVFIFSLVTRSYSM